MAPSPQDALDERGRRIGLIAVIERNERLLTIRRSASVRKPGKVCFPGGGLWLGETEEAGVEREVHEELGLLVRSLGRLDQSVTPWGTHLRWHRCELLAPARLTLKATEVSEVFWADPRELLAHPDLLESNAEFLERWIQGQFQRQRS